VAGFDVAVSRDAQLMAYGSLAFIVGGHMCRGIVGSELMVRVGPDAYARALSAPHARALAALVERGCRFVGSLPSRRPKPRAAGAVRQHG